MERPRIFLIGVAHVMDLRKRIESEIFSIAPRAVCVELDRSRLYALTHPDEISYKGMPFYMRLLASLQRKIGENYGIRAGEEMLAAVEAAKSIGAPLFLVDDDAYVSIKRMFKEMSLKEKLRFISALIPFPSLRRKTTLEKEIERYERDRERYMEEFAREFPTAKRILIDERNMHMAERIMELGKRYGRVVAVLGDAHLEGIEKIMVKKGFEVEIKHLKDLGSDLWIEVTYRHT